jgi:hypothetical protein
MHLYYGTSRILVVALSSEYVSAGHSKKHFFLVKHYDEQLTVASKW